VQGELHLLQLLAAAVPATARHSAVRHQQGDAREQRLGNGQGVVCALVVTLMFLGSQVDEAADDGPSEDEATGAAGVDRRMPAPKTRTQRNKDRRRQKASGPPALPAPELNTGATPAAQM